MSIVFQRIEIEPEKYRNPSPVHLVNFPFEVDPERLKLIGYFQGERLNRKEYLNVKHFDSISFVCNSWNEITKTSFIHAIGYRSKENSVKFLALKYETTT